MQQKSTCKLAHLLERLRKNRENVPLDVLKTKYGAPYRKLLSEIGTEAAVSIRNTAAVLPEWLRGQRVSPEHIQEIADVFDQIYREGDYAKKIGCALYRHYSADEVQRLCVEINRKYRSELTKYFHSKTCLYTTAESWSLERPAIPRIYNELVDKFWDEGQGQWITGGHPPGQAVLVFISGDKPDERKETL